MNITGSPNYSRETVGLRQPGKISNQQFKLIYAYPLLFSDTIGSDLATACRKFQTISFLKEIIVSNSLNIINMASQIAAPNAQSNSVAQLIGNAILTGGSSQNSTAAQSTVSPSMAYDIQSRVEEKTRQIKKYLNTDVRTKKLMPYVEIITLNNLVDVPVIVGTKGFNAMSYALLYILAIAIVTQTPLDRISNVESIIRRLKNTKETEWVTLLTSLTRNNPSFRESMVDNFKRSYPEFRNRLQLNRLTNFLLKGFEGTYGSNWFTRLTRMTRPPNENQEQRDLAASQQEIRQELNPIYNLLKLTKSSLDDVLLQFRFVLDPVLLKNQIGIDTTNNNMQTTVTKLSSNQRQIFMQMHDRFMEMISTPGSLFLSSAFNTLFPTAVETRNQAGGREYHGNININFLELKEKHFDSGLNGKIKRIIEDSFSKEITNSLGSMLPSESQEKVNLVKSLCQSMSQVDKILETEISTFLGTAYNSNTITTTNFDTHQLDRFTGGITRIANNFASMNKRFENVFSQLVNNSASLLKLAQTQIYSSIEDFMREIYDRPYYQSMMSYAHGVDDDKVKRIYIPQMTDTIFVIFYFFFLYRLQAAVCQYMDIIDVEIESKVNDVFEFPNYTLVLPIEIVKGVHASYVSNNLQSLLQGNDVRAVSSLNDNYIKGMIRFLCKRIKIPSIIVIDDAKKELYYQFMFMTAPEKISFSSLDAFIKSGVN